ncbi:MAG: hypothetical protein Q8P59_07515, partial [Dehalococcoidia bacterium]|nr:hypothetical protein [Dehalococcoidia bacterium]
TEPHGGQAGDHHHDEEEIESLYIEDEVYGEGRLRPSGGCVFGRPPFAPSLSSRQVEPPLL